MKIPDSYRKPLLIALALHIMLAVILIVQWPSLSYQVHGGSPQTNIVHATAVSAVQVQQAMQHINNQETMRERQEAQRVTALREQARHEAQLQQREAMRVAQMKQEQLHLKQQQEQQVRALAVLKQQQMKMAQAALLHAAAIKKMQAVKAAQAKAQQQAAQHVKLQQALKAQEAAKMVAQQKAQQALKALALKQQHSALLQQQQQRLQQKLLAQQLAGDSSQLQQIQARQMQGIIDKYKAMILSAIGQNWLVPDDIDKNLSSVFDIQLAPGGVVISVTLVKSSGNDALDQSAQTAIYKTSPLPVPQDPVEFNNFRDLRLTVSPKEIVHS